MNKQSLKNPYYKKPSFKSQPKVTRRNTSNTGKAFENLVIYSNNLYNLKGMAYVQKLETPLLIQQTYPDGSVKGKPKKSTVDFLGAENTGRMIAFDTKSTSETTRFPLDNIEDHQYEILKKYHAMNAHSFLLVEWTAFDEFYIVPFPFLQSYWEGAKNGGRKSIPYKEFASCPKVEKGKRGIALDYLEPFGIS